MSLVARLFPKSHFLRFLIIFAGVLGLLTIWYTLYAHDMIRAAFAASENGSKSLSFIDHTRHDLDYYLARADFIFWQFIVLGILGSLLFWWGMARLVRRLGREASIEARYPDSRFEIRHDWLLALVVYTGLTLVYFYPILQNIGAWIVGPPGDNLAGYWSLWWATDPVLHGGQALSYSNAIYFPEGSSLYYFAWSFYNLAVVALVRLFADLPAAFNVAMLHGYPIAGLGAFLLVRRVTGNSLIALIGGFVFAFNPNHFLRSQHHLHINSIQFIPFFVLAFWDAVRLGGAKKVLLATLFFLLNTLCEWTYMIMAGYFIFFGYLYLSIRNRIWWQPQYLKRAAIVVAVSLLVLSPWLVPMIKLALTTPDTDVGGRNTFVTDFVGLLVPGEAHFAGTMDFVTKINASYTGYLTESTSYLGLAALILVLAAARPLWRVAARWWLGFLAFLLLALGPQLHVLGKSLPIALPYTAIAYIPFLANVRAPARFMMYVYLFWAILVGLALAWLWAKAHSRRRQFLVTGIAGLVLLFDFFSMCHDKVQIGAPGGLVEWAKASTPAALVNLPSDYVNTMRYMMQQTIHGVPIVEGAATRKIGRSLADSLDYSDLARQHRQLADAGVSHIVVHKYLLPDSATLIGYYEREYAVAFNDDSCVIFNVGTPVGP